MKHLQGYRALYPRRRNRLLYERTYLLRGFSPQANYTDRATAACRKQVETETVLEICDRGLLSGLQKLLAFLCSRTEAPLKYLRGLSPRANYTDRATSACR
jgi:hypothetical protein